jgi:hypothetical protein
MAGVFAVPGVEGVSFTHNEFAWTASIRDSYDFELSGQGSAAGSYEGRPFTVTASTTARLRRVFDLAVAVLRGGIDLIFPQWVDFPEGKDEDLLRQQAAAVDKERVIAKGFKARSQLTEVAQWVQSLDEGRSTQVDVMMIGFSAGGNAVVHATQPRLRSRITIDPIDPGLAFDQRNRTVQPTPGGRFQNLLAETKGGLQDPQSRGLFGYQVAGVPGQIIPYSKHFTILPLVAANGTVDREVRACLSERGASPELTSRRSAAGSRYAGSARPRRS